MNRVPNFLKAILAMLAFGAPLALAAGALGAEPEDVWLLPILLAAMIFGSLFDKEGFYGDPHPFRRRAR